MCVHGRRHLGLYLVMWRLFSVTYLLICKCEQKGTVCYFGRNSQGGNQLVTLQATNICWFIQNTFCVVCATVDRYFENDACFSEKWVNSGTVTPFAEYLWGWRCALRHIYNFIDFSIFLNLGHEYVAIHEIIYHFVTCVINNKYYIFFVQWLMCFVFVYSVCMCRVHHLFSCGTCLI